MRLVLVPGSLPLAMLLPATPFCSRSPFPLGSGLRAALGGSGLLKRSGTLTGDRTLGGEGLLTRAADSVGNGERGLFALNNPLPGSRAGTDLAWLDSPLLSGYSWRGKRGGSENVKESPSIMSSFSLQSLS